LTEREKKLRQRRKQAEDIIAWKKKLDDEEIQVREIEKQGKLNYKLIMCSYFASFKKQTLFASIRELFCDLDLKLKSQLAYQGLVDKREKRTKFHFKNYLNHKEIS
jgi:hypothetical protein